MREIMPLCMHHIALPVRDNLELRTLDVSDAQTFFDVARKNNTYLRQWLSWADDDQTVVDTENYIKDSQKRFSQKEGLDLSIWHNNQLVGGIGFDPWNTVHKKVSIAY